MPQTPLPTERLGISAETGKSFIALLEADLAENAEHVVERLRNDKPYDYLRIIIGLLPSEVPRRRIEDMTDAELAILLRALANEHAAALAREQPSNENDQAGGPSAAVSASSTREPAVSISRERTGASLSVVAGGAA